MPTPIYMDEAIGAASVRLTMSIGAGMRFVLLCACCRQNGWQLLRFRTAVQTTAGFLAPLRPKTWLTIFRSALSSSFWRLLLLSFCGCLDFCCYGKCNCWRAWYFSNRPRKNSKKPSTFKGLRCTIFKDMLRTKGTKRMITTTLRPLAAHVHT